MRLLIIMAMVLALTQMALAEDANVTVCVPDIKCDQGACNNDNIYRCAIASDTNNCNSTYNMSMLDELCAYAASPGLEIETSANSSEAQEIEDLKVKGPGAKIDYTGETINLTDVNFSYVVIKDREITINSTATPELDKPARLTFYNIKNGWHIYKDGVECFWPVCTTVSYSKESEILVVDVWGFSSYTVGTYTEDDLYSIIVDGIGTVGAEIVYWLEIVVLAGVVFFIFRMAVELKK